VLPRRAVVALKTHLEKQDKELANAAELGRRPAWYFTTTLGSPIDAARCSANTNPKALAATLSSRV
jgi:hypothetical protein